MGIHHADSSAVVTLVVSTAIHNIVYDEEEIKPTLATYWFSAWLAGASILLVPFLRLGRQGERLSSVAGGVEYSVYRAILTPCGAMLME
jgi:MFS superfamily sulfate permease-like transporter